MKFEPLGMLWIQSFGRGSNKAPHRPTLKNLPKANPALEIITPFDDPVEATLGRTSNAESIFAS
jgi:hypothetical protein